MSSTRSVPPPSLQEVTRKLSVHSVKPHKPTLSAVAISGTESDSDSVFTPDVISPSPIAPASVSGVHVAATAAQPPLQSIAERRSQSGGEESEEDEEDEEGGWRTHDVTNTARGSLDETVIKTGYLWKKGERRKTWKKRWFVLRPAHLAFYKTSAEYKLLRLLELTDIHSCTQVVLKKHNNTFGLVSPTRTFYLQAETAEQVRDWVAAINEARHALLSTSTRNSVSSPIPIPTTPSAPHHAPRISSSPSQSPNLHQLTSSDSEDASPNTKLPVVPPPASGAGESSSPSKPVLSGYLMKCGSRRHNWHKRWFVLSGEKLIYFRSHMDTKPHRQVPLSLVIDALEYELPPHRNHPTVGSPSPASPQASMAAASPDDGEGAGTHTFKIVTTKRTLLLCAPSEEEEIRWLSAIRALIARRSGQGVVPGEAQSASASVSPPAGAAAGTTAPSTPGPANKRRDSIVRRLSLSGGGSPFIGGSSAPSAGASSSTAVSPGVQREGSSERQS
ncbi:PH-domain-containing protein [Lentinus tigrinus ALCF2SS1-7]|uniref:PH-domain-containing protein n=1 Tax=Lentinus tigrinus ALCF2SS1-7 TaxID=1328758 RepID=UPI00116631C9|nr:PH-domain-containing protein [Lentinus tigrinus ALCF2SS1-7]